MADETGPFETEADVRATRAAAALRAASDASLRGWEARHLKVMTDACEAYGVEVGAFDMTTLRQLAMYEPFHPVILAGLLHRAYEAGRAVGPDGAETEWGVRAQITRAGSPYEQPASSEDEARATLEMMRADRPEWGAVLLRRAPARPAGPWEEVPDA